MDISKLAGRMADETAKIICGKQRQIRLIVMALPAQGHMLLEALPGVGKTTLIKPLAWCRAASPSASSSSRTCYRRISWV